MWDARYGSLLGLRRASAPDGIRLEPISNKEIVNVMDAVADQDGAVLLVTPRGLYRHHISDHRLERLPVPDGERITTAARDRSGRLWAAGNRLHVSADNARTWRVIDLPMVSPTVVKRIRSGRRLG